MNARVDYVLRLGDACLVHGQRLADQLFGAPERVDVRGVDEGDSEVDGLVDDLDGLLAAGGPAGGFGAVISPWMGSKTRAVTAAIGVCVDCEPPKA